MSQIQQNIPVKLLNEFARMPEYSKDGDAGMDIFASCNVMVPCMTYADSNILEPTNSDGILMSSPSYLNRKLISTGVSLAIPKGYYGRVAPRSGLSCKGIDIGAGVVDSGYRGEIKVLFINNSTESYIIKSGDKIAQIVLTRIMNSPKLEAVDELPSSERGADGFGSTGK